MRKVKAGNSRNNNTRYRYRKQKKTNGVLKVAIAIVVLLIIFIGGKLILGDPPAEEAGVIQEESEETNEETAATENNEGGQVTQNKDVEIEDKEGQSNSTGSEEDKEKKELNEEESTDALESIEPNINGPWEPIGTNQKEPFTVVYKKDHQNWKEMTRALQYATGLDDSMIIWYLGNGGDHKSVVGTVSDIANEDQPYEVRLEWVERKGWKPVSVQQLEKNKYN